jgi:hypothetical protein
MKINVEIVRCTNHPDNYALTVSNRRIAGYKCCGTWSTFISWKLDSKELRHEVKQALAGAREAARKLPMLSR